MKPFRPSIGPSPFSSTVFLFTRNVWKFQNLFFSPAKHLILSPSLLWCNNQMGMGRRKKWFAFFSFSNFVWGGLGPLIHQATVSGSNWLSKFLLLLLVLGGGSLSSDCAICVWDFLNRDEKIHFCPLVCPNYGCIPSPCRRCYLAATPLPVVAVMPLLV